MRTVVAPCNLPAERLVRIEEQFRGVLSDWLEGLDGSARLDGIWQAAVERATGFRVDDTTVYR
ncbi:MAG: hypothetical protein GWO02_08145, partial [Gammaproteobacteria bacterium]|nr:hypothetical protein [Gammaproteobacteria bacterium]